MKRLSVRASQRILGIACSFLIVCSSTFSQTIPKVVVAEQVDAGELNPFTNLTPTGISVNEYLFCSLIRADKSTGDYVPLLAEALPDVSDDLQTFTYRVHPAAKFNNGKKILASDVAFTIKCLRNPFVTHFAKRSLYSAITDVQVLDERTVRIRIASPNAQGLRITGDFAVVPEEYFDPEHLTASMRLADIPVSQDPASKYGKALQAVAEKINVFGSSMEAFDADPASGSYILSEWKRGAAIVLTSNKRFWGRKLEAAPNDFFKQNVGEIRFETVNDPSTLRRAIFENKYDLVDEMPQNLFATLSEMPALTSKYQFLSAAGPAYEYIGMNMHPDLHQRNPAMGCLDVRRALAHLVHVDLLMVQVSNGIGTRIASDYPAAYPDYRNENLPLIPFNVQQAIEILDAAGWKDSDGNGLRDRTLAGDDVQLVLECIYVENRPDRQAIAEHLAENAMKAGILITLTPLPWKEYLARMEASDFDLGIGGWMSDPNEDGYRQIWHSQSANGGSNFVGFGTQASDAQIEQYDRTLDRGSRKSIAMEIQKTIYDLQPYIFLWAENDCLVLNKRFEKMAQGGTKTSFWIASWE